MEKSYTFDTPRYFNGIYCIVDPREPNCIRYIGKTSRGRKRFDQHFYDLEPVNHKNCWLLSLIDNGVKPHFSLLQEVSKDLGNAGLNDAEIQWIEKLSYIYPLTNSTTGGDGLCKGFKHSEEAKRKIAAASVGNHNTLGRKHTAEHKAYMSKVMKGKKNSLGVRQSQEAIDKRASKLRGRDKLGRAILDHNGVEYKSISFASRLLGISRTLIYSVLKGKRIDINGYFFKYKNADI